MCFQKAIDSVFHQTRRLCGCVTQVRKTRALAFEEQLFFGGYDRCPTQGVNRLRSLAFVLATACHFSRCISRLKTCGRRKLKASRMAGVLPQALLGWCERRTGFVHSICVCRIRGGVHRLNAVLVVVRAQLHPCGCCALFLLSPPHSMRVTEAKADYSATVTGCTRGVFKENGI